MRRIFTSVMWVLFRPKVVGRSNVPASGPVILAPVHRSFADFGFAAFCTNRMLFFMTKDSMWERKWLGRLLLYVGAFPGPSVNRPIARPSSAPKRSSTAASASCCSQKAPGARGG